MVNDLYYYLLDLCDGDKSIMAETIDGLKEMLLKDPNEYERIDSEEFGSKVVVK